MEVTLSWFVLRNRTFWWKIWTIPKKPRPPGLCHLANPFSSLKFLFICLFLFPWLVFLGRSILSHIHKAGRLTPGPLRVCHWKRGRYRPCCDIVRPSTVITGEFPRTSKRGLELRACILLRCWVWNRHLQVPFASSYFSHRVLHFSWVGRAP
jgi:hypothetical protein